MATEKITLLQIGDGSDWHFVNGVWQDANNRSLIVPAGMRRADGTGLQGHHYAFNTALAYQDVRVRFDFRLTSHSDVGIVLRARDEAHFALLHFTSCGQAARAQHFWAAYSHMDESGYLRISKLDMVRRVPSNDNLWLSAELALTGNQLVVMIGQFGRFEAEERIYYDAGQIGLFTFGDAEIRNVMVTGEPVERAWKDDARQPVNWFHPCPDTTYGRWQRPLDLLRLSDGELLLNYNVQEGPAEMKRIPLLVRSLDAGRTWSEPEPVPLLPRRSALPARIHLTPGGRLIALHKTAEGFYTAESFDRGHTWCAPVPTGLGAAPTGVEELHLGPQAFLNLIDSTILLFAYGPRLDLRKPDLPVNTWGSRHAQAFVCRSTDDGHTWSPWINVDNSGRSFSFDPAVPGQPVEGSMDGNLDLTEVCAAQTGDGRIMALVRPIYSPWMWETWSGDGGITWMPCVPGPFPGYATPNALRTKVGALLIAHRLPSMTLHASHDDGGTWDQGTMIDSAVWVMGSMLEVQPDVVLYVYWDSFESLMRAQWIRVTPGGLEPANPR